MDIILYANLSSWRKVLLWGTIRQQFFQRLLQRLSNNWFNIYTAWRHTNKTFGSSQLDECHAASKASLQNPERIHQKRCPRMSKARKMGPVPPGAVCVNSSRNSPALDESTWQLPGKSRRRRNKKAQISFDLLYKNYNEAEWIFKKSNFNTP